MLDVSTRRSKTDRAYIKYPSFAYLIGLLCFYLMTQASFSYKGVETPLYCLYLGDLAAVVENRVRISVICVFEGTKGNQIGYLDCKKESFAHAKYDSASSIPFKATRCQGASANITYISANDRKIVLAAKEMDVSDKQLSTNLLNAYPHAYHIAYHTA